MEVQLQSLQSVHVLYLTWHMGGLMDVGGPLKVGDPGPWRASSMPTAAYFGDPLAGIS